MDILEEVARTFVGVARSMPKGEAFAIVYQALVELRSETIVATSEEAKLLADGLHGLAKALSDVVRTKGPLIPLMMELVALEDACRSCTFVEARGGRIADALAKVAAARELPRGRTAEAR